MLSKVRHYVKKSVLKNIYHAIFESHLRYGCQIWFLSSSKFIKDKLEKLQKKALRIMSFSDLREPSSPLFKEWKILNQRYSRNTELSLRSFISKGKTTQIF